VYKENYIKLKANIKSIISRLKVFYQELFNKSFPKYFDRLEIIKSLQLASIKYNIKIFVYNLDENNIL
jgi:hypothetical protein